jgi:hypothetical protein
MPLQVYRVVISVREWRGLGQWRAWRKWWEYQHFFRSGIPSLPIEVSGRSTELFTDDSQIVKGEAWQRTRFGAYRLKRRYSIILILGHGKTIKARFAPPPYPDY